MSTLEVDLISNELGTGPVTLVGGKRGAYARHDYNQTANTINETSNVSSITDDSAGNHTVAYINAFLNIYYLPGYNVMEDANTRGMSASGLTTVSDNYGDNKKTISTAYRCELQNNNAVDSQINTVSVAAEGVA